MIEGVVVYCTGNAYHMPRCSVCAREPLAYDGLRRLGKISIGNLI